MRGYIMNISIKNLFAVMLLITIAGNNTASCMKRKDTPKDLEQQEKDKKQKISTETQKEKSAAAFINKHILPKFCINFYISLKKDAIINDTYIKKNNISLDTCNPYILQKRGVPLDYFSYIKRAFQLVEIIKNLITSNDITSDFITKTGLSINDLGPENIPTIPLEYCPIIKKAYDQKCAHAKKPQSVRTIAKELGMNAGDFIEILKERLNAYDHKTNVLNMQISPDFIPKEVAIDAINSDTMLGHPDTMTSLQYYSKIRTTYDDRKKNCIDII